MRYAFIIATLILISSCIANKEGMGEKLEEIQNHPDDFITPNGITVTFPVIDSGYHLSWQRDGYIDTLELSLPLINHGHVTYPYLISENEYYLYFENGCGSPCWNGFFLPLEGDVPPRLVSLPIAHDLNNHFVASISVENGIDLLNLKTAAKFTVNTENCGSVFSGYCIDSAYFENNSFYYAWDSIPLRSKEEYHFIEVPMSTMDSSKVRISKAKIEERRNRINNNQ